MTKEQPTFDAIFDLRHIVREYGRQCPFLESAVEKWIDERCLKISQSWTTESHGKEAHPEVVHQKKKVMTLWLVEAVENNCREVETKLVGHPWMTQLTKEVVILK